MMRFTRIGSDVTSKILLLTQLTSAKYQQHFLLAGTWDCIAASPSLPSPPKIQSQRKVSCLQQRSWSTESLLRGAQEGHVPYAGVLPLSLLGPALLRALGQGALEPLSSLTGWLLHGPHTPFPSLLSSPEGSSHPLSTPKASVTKSGDFRNSPFRSQPFPSPGRATVGILGPFSY